MKKTYWPSVGRLFLLIGILVALGFLFEPHTTHAQLRDIIPTEQQVFGSQGSPLRDYFSSPQSLIAKIFQLVISVAGAVFLLMLLFGGLMYLVGAGNEDSTGKAKRMMTDALVGLIIILASYAIGTWVLRSLGLTTAGSGATSSLTTNNSAITTAGTNTTNNPKVGTTTTTLLPPLIIPVNQRTTSSSKQRVFDYGKQCTKAGGEVLVTYDTQGANEIVSCIKYV